TLVGAAVYAGEARWGGATTTAVIEGGTVTIEGDGTQAALTLRGGTCNYAGTGTITALSAGGGTLDLSRGVGAMTITAAEVYKGATIRDPAGRVAWTAGLDLH